MANARRLPGIQVDVAPPPAADALPRLDVAVFVGFAATGPLHLPVAVESVAQYAAVFGADAPLAWDSERGERVFAHLGPSVRAFFANGGRRCWVLRVARSAAMERVRLGEDAPLPTAIATANRYALPGLLAIDGTGAIAPAIVAARCEGSWSDGLRVDAAAQQRGFALDSWSVIDSPAAHRFAFLTRQPLRVGDLLRFDQAPAIQVYARVEHIAAGSTPAAPYRVEVRVLAAFEALIGDGSPDEISGDARIAGLDDELPATLHSPRRLAAGWGPAAVQLQAPLASEQLSVGAWLRFAAGAQIVWLRLDEIDRVADLSISPVVDDAIAVLIKAQGPAWRELDPAKAWTGPVESAQWLQLELRALGADGAQSRLRSLALTPLGSGHFWQQQRDQDYYRQRDDLASVPPAELQRYPLAPDDAPRPLAWLPLGLQANFGASVGPLTQTATALERDGLARFDRDLFLDPALEADSVQTLIAHADDIRLIRPSPRPLYGLHAVFGIGAGGLFNEASLLALPDAIHLGWQRRLDPPDEPAPASTPTTPPHWRDHRGACLIDPPSQDALSAPDFSRFLDCSTRLIAAPVLDGPDAPVSPGRYRLSWTQSEAGARYALFEAGLADFSDQREIYNGELSEYVAISEREGRYHYRVVAQVGGEYSLPSNPVTVRVRADEWVLPTAATVEAGMEAEWLAVHRAALRLGAACGDLFVVLSMPRHFRTAQALRYSQRLRAVRGAGAAIDPLALAFDEARALSYGALYFPWLQSDARGGALAAGSLGALSPGAGAQAGADRDPQRWLRVVPPDGVATGVFAARASQRGAWIAAANEPMRDVVALTPRIADGDRAALQDAQINLLRDDPRGFFALSADTLALDEELRPINVRRLLILLRRMALRRGSSYVFEPNGPVLWRSVQRGFDLLLGDLFQRGAFAGATAEQSFRVVTDEGVNPPQSVESGRFVVELRVAPSLPMRFIAVRLAQSGERLTVKEEL
ncbi:hypothetical protein [Lysobacter capsici]|uniref:hypothetical protein n=1 Tax=Lysobacter capsici TaxID=435897 RepID=UPI0006279F2F|nr:hypothetical protein [Lysobacter capsici]